MNRKIWVTLLGLMYAGFACTSKKGPGDLLIEANEVHQEAMAIYHDTHERYEAVKKKADELGDSLVIARLDSIHDLLHNWEEGLYEVPGFEHSHEHSHEGHSHDHSHKTAPAMTDQSMLDYQKNAKSAIEEIREMVEGM